MRCVHEGHGGVSPAPRRRPSWPIPFPRARLSPHHPHPTPPHTPPLQEPEFFSDDCGFDPARGCNATSQAAYVRGTLRLRDVLDGELVGAAGEASTHYGRNGQLLAAGVYEVGWGGAGGRAQRGRAVRGRAGMWRGARLPTCLPRPQMLRSASRGSRSLPPCGSRSGEALRCASAGPPCAGSRLAAARACCSPGSAPTVLGLSAPLQRSRATSMLAHNLDLNSKGCLTTCAGGCCAGVQRRPEPGHCQCCKSGGISLPRAYLAPYSACCRYCPHQRPPPNTPCPPARRHTTLRAGARRTAAWRWSWGVRTIRRRSSRGWTRTLGRRST